MPMELLPVTTAFPKAGASLHENLSDVWQSYLDHSWSTAL